MSLRHSTQTVYLESDPQGAQETVHVVILVPSPSHPPQAASQRHTGPETTDGAPHARVSKAFAMPRTRPPARPLPPPGPSQTMIKSGSGRTTKRTAQGRLRLLFSLVAGWPPVAAVVGEIRHVYLPGLAALALMLVSAIVVLIIAVALLQGAVTVASFLLHLIATIV